MRTWKQISPISSILLRCSTTHKPFSSSSSTSLSSFLLSNFKTLVPSLDSLISQQPNSKSILFNEFPHSNHLKTANLQIPISQNHQDSTFLSQSQLASVVLSLKNQPLSALKFFNGVEKHPGFDAGVESLCVLFHILLSSNSKHVKKLVSELVSNQQCPDATIVIQGLMESATRFEFCVSDRAFKTLLNCFLVANRIEDAIVCYNVMIDKFGKELGASFANLLFKVLIRRNRFNDVEVLLNKMFSKGITRDVKIIRMMLKSCIMRGKFEEAEQLFRKVRGMGFELGANTYSCAVEAVSKKPDSNAAYELLNEMKKKGWVPSTSTFNSVIKACVQQKKMAEALRIKDEMILCENPMVATSLIKGYCELGDLDSAFNLFTRIIEDGHSPKRFTFVVMIKAYCDKGKMEEAIKLYNLMAKTGIKSSVYVTFLLVKGFLDAQSWEKAYEQLITAVESGIINFFSYNFLMAWLCAKGKVDESRKLWDKIVENGSIPTVVCYNYFGNSEGKSGGLSSNMVGKGFKPNAVTYTILMEGYFKKGEVERALKVFDEMVSQGTICIAYTYNTIIHGLCYNGQMSEARVMLEKFTEGGNFKPSFTTYNFIIDRYIEEDDINSASSVSTEMSNKGISRDIILRRNLVEELCKCNEFDHALKMLKEMVNKGFELDVSAYEALIYVFCQRRKMKTALRLFSELLYAGLPPSQYILKSISKGFQAIEEKDDIEVVAPPKNGEKMEQKIACDSETRTALG